MKTTKESGFLVKIESFVPADLADIKALAALQQVVEKACSELPNATRAITPTRR